MHDSYKICLTMPEVEKANLLGLIGHGGEMNEVQASQSAPERMQRFLTGLHESCFHMIGSVGPSLGRDLYNLPELGQAVVNSVLACLQVRLQIFCFRFVG